MATSEKCFQGIQTIYQVSIIFKRSLTVSAFCQFGADVCLYGFSTFLPIIIEAMGYSAVAAQYLTIPGTTHEVRFNFSLSLGCLGIFYHCMVVGSNGKTRNLPWNLDPSNHSWLYHSRGRCPCKETWSLVLCYLPHSHRSLRGRWPQYHVSHTLTSCNLRWLGANVAPHYKRSTAVGFQQTLANTAGVVAGQIYLKSEAPGYIIGHSVSLGCIAASNAGFWILMAHLKRLNSKKSKMKQELEKEGRNNVDVGEGDLSLDFRYHM